VRFLRPFTIIKMEKKKGDDGPIAVTLKNEDTKEVVVEEFDTVLHAIGRDACIPDLQIEKFGVTVKDGKILTDEFEQSSVANIYAIGDCAYGRPELTPSAIAAGGLLARRLYGGSKIKMDYVNVPTTIFTPLEYGCVGYSQEAAEQAFGKHNIESFSSRFGYLESATTFHESIPKVRSRAFIERNLWARKHALSCGRQWEDFKSEDFEEEERASKHLKQPCLAKLVIDKSRGDRVVGFHYIGPNAGEVTQGYALAVKLGATKSDFDALVGIHPTCAEEFTILGTKNSSGEDLMKKGGC